MLVEIEEAREEVTILHRPFLQIFVYGMDVLIKMTPVVGAYVYVIHNFELIF